MNPPTWLPQPKLARVLGQWFSWGASLLTYLLRKRDRESGAGYLTKELPRVLSPSEMPGSRHGYLIGIGKVGHLWLGPSSLFTRKKRALQGVNSVIVPDFRICGGQSIEQESLASFTSNWSPPNSLLTERIQRLSEGKEPSFGLWRR